MFVSENNLIEPDWSKHTEIISIKSCLRKFIFSFFIYIQGEIYIYTFPLPRESSLHGKNSPSVLFVFFQNLWNLWNLGCCRASSNCAIIHTGFKNNSKSSWKKMTTFWSHSRWPLTSQDLDIGHIGDIGVLNGNIAIQQAIKSNQPLHAVQMQHLHFQNHYYLCVTSLLFYCCFYLYFNCNFCKASWLAFYVWAVLE